MENNIRETYEKVKADILEGLNDLVLSDENKDILDNTFSKIFSDINENMNSDDLIETKITVEDINSILTLFEKMLALQALTPKSQDVINKCITCIYNWNVNIKKDSKIQEHIEVCSRILLSCLTMTETINILKSLTKHLEQNILKDIKKSTDGISQSYIRLLGLED